MEFSINVFHHNADVGKLDEILKRLKSLEAQGVTMHQDFLDLAKKIDDATNAVAARLDKLSGQVKNSMTDEEVAQVKTALQAEVDRLTTLGSDPANPVPVTP